MRETLLKIITSAVPEIVLFIIKGFKTFIIFGVPINLLLVIIASTLTVTMPHTFDMGVSDWEHASLLAKASPIIVCIFLMLGTSFMHKSYATLIVDSFFLGFIFTYVGKVIASK